MKVYVISLRRAVERRKYIKAHLENLGLTYEIVDAIDYQEMAPADYAALVDADAAAANPYLTKGVQACALSHAKACEAIAAANDRVALVLEDDAALPASISTSLDLIEAQIGEDEVIALSYYSHFHDGIELSSQQVTKLADGSSLYYPVNMSDMGSGMAYVVTRQVAAKIPKLVVPVRVAADYWGEHFKRGAFSSFRCLYPIPAQAATFRSTLDYLATVQSTSRKVLTALVSTGAKLVRAFKIPFLYPYLEKRDKQRSDKKYMLRFVDSAPFFPE